VLGDAVLKLVQTDSLLRSSDLQNWIKNSHEGDLDIIRSELGSNMALKEKCLDLKFNKYVLTANLARGKWSPASLELYSSTVDSGEIIQGSENGTASGKTCADIMEAILGLVYRCQGYDASLQVANELNLTVPSTGAIVAVETTSYDEGLASVGVLEIASKFTGYPSFRSLKLVEEAFTHTTDPRPGISSYERLEWIGDAVLCLAVRNWIMDQYHDTKTVGEMVSSKAKSDSAYFACPSNL
jgi:endoribonuclease Dicer